jgi:HEAT repeat protein
LLDSDDAAVRGFAALGLGIHGGRAATGDLDRLVRTESDEDVIFAATWALGRTGDPSRAETLVHVLDGRGGAVAEVAAGSLGLLGGPTAEGALVRSLFDPDAALRRAAARALRRSAAPRGTQDILPPPQTFERVRDYVHRIADRGDDAPPVDDLARWQEPLEAAATEALRGPVERVLPALTVLASRPRGVGLGALTADLDRWPAEARGAAERSLDALAFALVDELVEVTTHVDAAVRIEAVRLLVRLPGPDSDRAVAAALSAPPASVQRAALDALAAADREPTGAMLERLAELTRGHRDWSMRTRAAHAMARSRSEEARGALREALASDRYAFVREAAATALGAHPSEADVAALEAALADDGEPQVRAAAARALVGLGGAVGARASRRAAADASPAVQAIATSSPPVR